MPETLPDHVPSPRTLLAWDGTAYRPLTIDAAGHLQLDVVTSGLPAGAATAAAQALALAQLQLIEDMRDALQSVATDRLIVRGEDQLFSFDKVLGERTDGLISGADGFFDSAIVPAGEIWVVTTVAARDNTTGVTVIVMAQRHNGADAVIHEGRKAFAVGEWSSWSGLTTLDVDDLIRVYFTGGLVNDHCYVDLSGYVMTLET